jgi:phage terminase large subunit-like protein
MNITPQMEASVPFQYADDVRTGRIITGKRIRQAVERFYKWIDDAEKDGFTLKHSDGMFAIGFFPQFLNHIEGKKAGQPFDLMPFQQFTIYNLFAWQNSNGLRRIRTVYDKRAKKNGKTLEMAGLALYCMSLDGEVKAGVYVGATKEDQAKLCFNAAADLINSFVANPALRILGFKTLQNRIHFVPSNSFMRPLGGDSDTQDGINAHLAIIDEYHAHKTDGVKENLESSAVLRAQPITYHITTAGTNVSSVCKAYEDSVIEVLDGIKVDNHLWIMIHDLDENDDWEDQKNWFKANPLLGQGMDIENMLPEYIKAKNQPSKAPNFKTKHLNMWVDAPQIWIPSEIWDRNKVDVVPIEKFEKFGSFFALDLSSTTDLTFFGGLSEPDENDVRYVKGFFFCPEDTIDRRSKEDRVPYRYWRDAGFLISTPGEVVDYNIIEDVIVQNFPKYNINRLEVDRWNATSVVTNLMEQGLEVSYFSQAISNMSFPTKTFEKLVYEGKVLHDGNPIFKWMLSGCVVIEDANENKKIHKGQSNRHGKRVDGIIGLIMALGGSLSPKEETNESYYNDPNNTFEC